MFKPEVVYIYQFRIFPDHLHPPDIMVTTGIQTPRQRLRMACEPCRERKRKCDGNRPCDHCRGYGFDCLYRSTPRSRRRRPAVGVSVPSNNHAAEGSSSVTTEVPSRLQEPRQHHEQRQPRQSQPRATSPETSLGASLRVESNSGAAFARLLTITLDPSDQSSPPLRMLAWNLYLGERRAIAPPLPLARLTDILPEAEMHRLATIYLEKVHPCYGFVNREMLSESIAYVWRGPSSAGAQHAVLCGVAALACLFSGAQDLTGEVSLVALAKHLLDLATADAPDVHTATAWLLRTVYLRLTARPEEAWLASCTTLHVIDAAGLISGVGRSSAFSKPQDPRTVDMGQRIFRVAQHLNMWMSYDLGRSRVVLQNQEDNPPSVQPGEYTAELLDLLPYSEHLDPGHEASVESLTTALAEVLARNHTQPPSVLAQCNLMLCIYRRLHASKSVITEGVMNAVLNLIKRSIQAVRSSIAEGLPWHHVANVPFQVICTLLVIDTAPSFALLADALRCLELVNDTHQTGATREAVLAAYALLQLHQKRREAEVKKQSDMLSLYPAIPCPSTDNDADVLNDPALLDSWWFNEFVADLDIDLT